MPPNAHSKVLFEQECDHIFINWDMRGYTVRMDINIEDVINAAHAGGKIVKQYFGEVLETEQKSNVGDLRT